MSPLSQTLMSVRVLLLAVTLLGAGAARAQESVQDVLDRVANLNSTPRRIEAISAMFLGRPYVGGPLGEGPEGKYDRDPLERLDAFDCTTYVETVTALALSRTPAEFSDLLRRLRYKDGRVDFTLRNHFPSADWVPNNIMAGFFEEITARVLAPRPVLTARALIDKPRWYSKMTIARINREDLTEEQRLELLEELRAEGSHFEAREATLPYLPLKALFGERGAEILERIPSGAVVNIVRPNWNLTESIGTHMNVSHQGLAIRRKGVLYLRHASDGAGKVAEQPMTDYLKPFLTSPTLKGIHLLEIR